MYVCVLLRSRALYDIRVYTRAYVCERERAKERKKARKSRACVCNEFTYIERGEEKKMTVLINVVFEL